jgi:hypothetical protein
MKTFKLFLILAVFLILCAPNVYANSFDDQFGSKITIYDNRSGTWSGSNGAEYGGSGWWTSQTEDQEVEPGMIPNQVWDLEGFVLKNKSLSIVAGFDLRDGNPYGGYQYMSGDIFIDDTNQTSGKAFNGYTYEYVLDMDYSTGKYSVYMLNSNSQFNEGKLVEETNYPLSAPYRYQSGGTAVTGWQNISFTYYDFNSTLMTNAMTGYSGTNHNALTVDLGFLPDGTDFISHFTIECGNDNLMGETEIPTHGVPEPATMLLLGLGLIGVAAIRRKF